MHKVFSIRENAPQHAKFATAIPLPPGKFFTSQALRLVDGNSRPFNCHLMPNQLWPDNSIKWLLVNGCLEQQTQVKTDCYLVSFEPKAEPKTEPKTEKEPPPIIRSNWVVQQANSIKLNTRVGSLTIDTSRMLAITFPNQSASSFCISCENVELNPQAIDYRYLTQYDADFNPVYCEIELKQIHEDMLSQEAIIIISAKLTIYYEDGQILINVQAHNPKAIVQADGQWDLGNENSVFLKEFSFDIAHPENEIASQACYQDSSLLSDNFEKLEVRQFSSGGVNWNSNNHKDRNAEIKFTQKGATAIIFKPNSNTTMSIDRAIPAIVRRSTDSVLYLKPHYFWQKFPSSLSITKYQTRLDFARPEVNPDEHVEVELQPGEIKAHEFSLACVPQSVAENWLKHFAAEDSTFNNSILIFNEADSGTQANFAMFRPSLTEHPLSPCLNLNDLEADNWHQKREQLDEYGWRNFGDLYADHEAAEHTGDDVFVSHYNNQYDPLWGFQRLWLLSKNPSFKKLADELFEHTINIDIYHTDYDKPEYNRGLFWHTDHYVQAETATHRTYSKRQASSVYMDHAGGGGPGAHHCYSSGLSLYFQTTGDKRAKKAVLGMGHWMSNIYEGDGTLLGFILRAKNANYLRMPFTDKLLLGSGTGIVRNPFTNQYPLDRGTGNYVNTLLDCFEITGNYDYLLKCENIILNTISETDDISKRHFDDIENTWFYIVFMQSIVKYLQTVAQQFSVEATKTSIIDERKVNAIQSAFLHYASWIAKNESHYLSHKDKLEYPNDTWTGQDLRKIHVLLAANELSKSNIYREKANALIDFVYPRLLKSDETKLTRIQALIMQNFINSESLTDSFCGLEALKSKPMNNTPFKINPSILVRILTFMKNYSVTKEYRLILVRIPALQKVFKK